MLNIEKFFKNLFSTEKISDNNIRKLLTQLLDFAHLVEAIWKCAAA